MMTRWKHHVIALLFILSQCHAVFHDPHGGLTWEQEEAIPDSYASPILSSMFGYSDFRSKQSELETQLLSARAVQQVSVPALHPGLRWVGRKRETEEGAIQFDFPGVKVEFILQGTTFLNAVIQEKSQHVYALVVDGQLIQRVSQTSPSCQTSALNPPPSLVMRQVTTHKKVQVYELLAGLKPSLAYKVEIIKESDPKGTAKYVQGANRLSPQQPHPISRPPLCDVQLRQLGHLVRLPVG